MSLFHAPGPWLPLGPFTSGPQWSAVSSGTLEASHPSLAPKWDRFPKKTPGALSSAREPTGSCGSLDSAQLACGNLWEWEGARTGEAKIKQRLTTLGTRRK